LALRQGCVGLLLLDVIGRSPLCVHRSVQPESSDHYQNDQKSCDCFPLRRLGESGAALVLWMQSAADRVRSDDKQWLLVLRPQRNMFSSLIAGSAEVLNNRALAVQNSLRLQ
jgi:hypothetical protein